MIVSGIIVLKLTVDPITDTEKGNDQHDEKLLRYEKPIPEVCPCVDHFLLRIKTMIPKIITIVMIPIPKEMFPAS